MSSTQIELSEFLVAGISVRTINNGQAGADIKHLWDRFYKQDISSLIPGKITADIYCVYTDYKSYYNDYYTCVLGCKVSSVAVLPEGILGCVIPASVYEVYESKGNLPHSVIATWQRIWDSGFTRQYKADFDIYTNKSWAGGSVLTYVGI